MTSVPGTKTEMTSPWSSVETNQLEWERGKVSDLEVGESYDVVKIIIKKL